MLREWEFWWGYQRWKEEFHSLYPVNNAPSKCVLSVHGLDPLVMTPVRVFNLLCVFGNVAKVCLLWATIVFKFVRSSIFPKKKGHWYKCVTIEELRLLSPSCIMWRFLESSYAYFIATISVSKHLAWDKWSLIFFEVVTDKTKGISKEEEGLHAVDFTGSPLNRFSRNPTKYVDYIHSKHIATWFCI